MSGANVDRRTTTASNFADARFPGTVTNALEHADTLVWGANRDIHPCWGPSRDIHPVVTPWGWERR